MKYIKQCFIISFVSVIIHAKLLIHTVFTRCRQNIKYNIMSLVLTVV